MRNTILGFRPPERPALQSHIQYSGQNKLLSPPEVDAIRAWCDEQVLAKGTIGNGDASQAREVESYRCVETCAVNGDQFEWLYDRLAQRIQWINNDFYRFTLSGFAEPIGYLKYTAPENEGDTPGHYDWHQDFGGGPYSGRKLSVVIQLSNPDEYEGCELELFNDGPWTVNYKEAGDAIIFPSWTPHRVTNITRGVRRALVLWVSGPQFQ